MPLPREVNEQIDNLAGVETSLAAIDTKVSALPAVPLEADLPEIVEIVADVKEAAASLKAVVDVIVRVLATTRINQS